MVGNFFFKTPFLGWISVPTSFVSLFIFYIFSYLLSKTMGYFSGCLMFSAGIQKLFCGIYSAFKCSFDEFVRKKLVSLSYSSAILGLPPESIQPDGFPVGSVVKNLTTNEESTSPISDLGRFLMPQSN